MNLHFPASIVLTLIVSLLLASFLIPASFWIVSSATKRTAARKFSPPDGGTDLKNQRHIIPRKYVMMPDKRNIVP